MICIVDYGVGNIQAFLNLFKRLGVEACRADTPYALSDADRLVLPGVGHFDHAMARLEDKWTKCGLQETMFFFCVHRGTHNWQWCD